MGRVRAQPHPTRSGGGRAQLPLEGDSQQPMAQPVPQASFSISLPAGFVLDPGAMQQAMARAEEEAALVGSRASNESQGSGSSGAVVVEVADSSGGEAGASAATPMCAETQVC